MAKRREIDFCVLVTSGWEDNFPQWKRRINWEDLDPNRFTGDEAFFLLVRTVPDSLKFERVGNVCKFLPSDWGAADSKGHGTAMFHNHIGRIVEEHFQNVLLRYTHPDWEIFHFQFSPNVYADRIMDED